MDRQTRPSAFASGHSNAASGIRNSHRSGRQDVEFGVGAHVRCFGKGRKMRCTPLRSDVTAVLKEWLSRQEAKPDAPVFPSSKMEGGSSADAFAAAVGKACRDAM